MGRQINLRVSLELLRAIDGARGDVPRNRFIVRLLEANMPGGDLVVQRAAVAGDGGLGRGEATANWGVARGVVFRCRRCEFVAGSPAARCPSHPGVLVPEGTR